METKDLKIHSQLVVSRRCNRGSQTIIQMGEICTYYKLSRCTSADLETSFRDFRERILGKSKTVVGLEVSYSSALGNRGRECVVRRCCCVCFQMSLEFTSKQSFGERSKHFMAAYNVDIDVSLPFHLNISCFRAPLTICTPPHELVFSEHQTP